MFSEGQGFSIQSRNLDVLALPPALCCKINHELDALLPPQGLEHTEALHHLLQLITDSALAQVKERCALHLKRMVLSL